MRESAPKSHDSTRQNVSPLEVSPQPDDAGLTCSRPVTMIAAYSTLLTAGTAAAHGESPGMVHMQQAWAEGASQRLDALVLADFSLLPSFNGQPFQILGFLLNHPFITLGLALAVNYVVPRAFRALVRFLVIPLVLGSIAWVALQNPSTAWDLLRGTFDCKRHHVSSHAHPLTLPAGLYWLEHLHECLQLHAVKCVALVLPKHKC